MNTRTEIHPAKLMVSSKKIILYHAYGQVYLYNQVRFALLTLLHYLKGEFGQTTVIIYTDKPAVFTPYQKTIPLKIELLTERMISEFKGELNFVHRVKICVLQDCFKKYQSDILYLDSDTYFTTSPAPLLENIRQGHTVMNSNDYDLMSADELYENTDWLLIRRAIKNFTYKIDGQNLQVPLTTRMWNAGVIGLSYSDSNLLAKVLSLADQIYSNKKVFTAEQFAFSYILQSKTELISSGDVIFHYWRFFGKYKWRQTYTYHLQRFFKKFKNQPISEQVKEAYDLTLRHSELRLPPKSLFQKIIGRFQLVTEAGLYGKIKSKY
ncbi:MAG: hypothetical protein ABIR19_11195 [Ginsengibacter sp.]